MTPAAIIAFLKGPGLLLVALGWAAKMALGYGGWRYWQARRARRVRVADMVRANPEQGL